MNSMRGCDFWWGCHFRHNTDPCPARTGSPLTLCQGLGLPQPHPPGHHSDASNIRLVHTDPGVLLCGRLLTGSGGEVHLSPFCLVQSHTEGLGSGETGHAAADASVWVPAETRGEPGPPKQPWGIPGNHATHKYVGFCKCKLLIAFVAYTQMYSTHSPIRVAWVKIGFKWF